MTAPEKIRTGINVKVLMAILIRELAHFKTKRLRGMTINYQSTSEHTITIIAGLGITSLEPVGI